MFRFSQDMTIIDTELPYSLIDLSLSVMTTIMGAILMCLSAGYFAAMMPPVMLGVWGKSPTVQLRLLLTLISSVAEVLFENLPADATPRSGSEISPVLALP
jgi:hypothetical protein